MPSLDAVVLSFQQNSAFHLRDGSIIAAGWPGGNRGHRKSTSHGLQLGCQLCPSIERRGLATDAHIFHYFWTSDVLTCLCLNCNLIANCKWYLQALNEKCLFFCQAPDILNHIANGLCMCVLALVPCFCSFAPPSRRKYQRVVFSLDLLVTGKQPVFIANCMGWVQIGKQVSLVFQPCPFCLPNSQN